MIKAFLRSQLLENFERLFVCSALLILGFILYISDQKLSLLNIYFIPVLLAGYFINTRGAVLGSLLSILIVMLFFILNPGYFEEKLGRMGPYLHLVSWASLLILAGALAGGINQQFRDRFSKVSKTLADLNQLQEDLFDANKKLEAKNQNLEATKTRLESVLYSTMDPLVAKLVIHRELRHEIRQVTVLSADLPEFSHCGDMGPEATVKSLNRVFGSMEAVLSQYWGHLDKYIGSGFMAEFGMPYALEQHALLAALAAVKMQERMALRDFPWKMRIGLASGPSWIGLLGSGNRSNYTVLGDAVRLSSELKALCRPDGVAVDENVQRQIEPWFHIRRLGALLNTEKIKAEKTDLETAFTNPQYAQTPKAALATQKNAHAYEILGLKDPLADEHLIPRFVALNYNKLLAHVKPPLDMLLPIEALEKTLGHAQVTAALAAALAEALGLEERQVRHVFLAGCLHDIGKRNVPEHLLNYEHRMSELPQSDQALIQNHVREAAKVLRQLGLPSNPQLLETIAQHHERCDGSGYPEGLKGEQICLPAHLLAIADTYATLISDKSGQQGHDREAALKEVLRQIEAGQLDPLGGKVFVQILRAG